MSDTNNDKKLSAEMTPYIFRILNGLMAGCEFLISTERALIIVGSDKNTDLIDPLSTLPSDTFFIPTNGTSFNFEIIVNDGDKRTLLVRELSNDVNHESEIKFNERYQLHDFIFAVKVENDEWDNSVLGLPSIIEKKTDKTSKIIIILLISGVIFCLCLISFITISFYNSDETQQRKLNRILVNNDKEYTLIKGRDGIFHIFVQNQRVSLWVIQAIKRGDFKSPTRVFYPFQEAQYVAQWLETHYGILRFVRLQLDDPLHPLLIVSQRDSRQTLPDLKKVEEELLNIMPYASMVMIKIMNDETIIKEAQEGLDAIGLAYSYNKNRSLTNFLIRGNLNDSQLQRLQTFMTGFYYKWGGDVVKFNVELEDDRLHNNSISYGEMQYLKSGGDRWNFNID
ncbi:TPA: PrgH/EprH family type III secretion apparatus protein [Escherichia fergusonii]|nr:PrgH/EprH family type III secretion apparatus protein [Escherichia fergusonii]HCO8235808.1 PrgH/EprH family type III secretion apparatus protein [Escherichia fergusonii]